MNSLRPFRGWLALVVTIVLWALAAYSYWSVEQQKRDYAILVENVAKEAQLVAQASRLHGLMNDTKDGRAVVAGIISSDVIGLVDAIDAVGKTAGLDLQISNVQPEPQKKGTPAGAPVPVTFSVRADGSFAQIVRLMELLNSLPMPSSVQQVEMQRSGTMWHVTGRFRVLTAAISS